jgi:RimJ/RimL family protein N-acetyltransferase
MMNVPTTIDLNNPPVLRGKRIYLKELRPSDVNAAYCRWMNDPGVNQYLESRFQPATEKSIKRFVQGVLDDPNSCLFGIRLRENDEHIGNIKIGPITLRHYLAEVGILIGEKRLWGKGYASEALNLLIEFAFNGLKLHKLSAGCYSVHESSFSLFTKSGFEVDGVRKQHWFSQGKYVDGILFGLINPMHRKQEKQDWK